MLAAVTLIGWSAVSIAGRLTAFEPAGPAPGLSTLLTFVCATMRVPSSVHSSEPASMLTRSSLTCTKPVAPAGDESAIVPWTTS